MLCQAQNIILLIILSFANLLELKKTYLITLFKSPTLHIQTVLIITKRSPIPPEWSSLNYNKKTATFKSSFISCTRPLLISRSRLEWPTYAIPLCISSGSEIRTRSQTLMCRFMLVLQVDHVRENNCHSFPCYLCYFSHAFICIHIITIIREFCHDNLCEPIQPPLLVFILGMQEVQMWIHTFPDVLIHKYS